MKDWLNAVLDIGPFRAAYRVAWEADRRSGMKRLRQPVGHVPIPSDVPTWDEWWGEVPDQCWLRDLPIARATTDATRDRAEAALAGRVDLFGAWGAEVGAPPDWHLEPQSGAVWPKDVHWTEALDAGVGDPRLTWELNRFLHVWDWIRLFREDGDARWAAAFAEHLESWAKENPFRAGINWASGQELAVRVVSWLAAVATFGEQLGAGTFRTFVELAYWHGVHIESELGFARWAVPNNHLIAEATALATLGSLFRWRESDRWRRRGLKLLRAAIDQQFRADGGYCQSSHTYHRFALEWLLLADGMFELGVEDVFRRSLHYLDAMIVGEGELPNFGPNDGARLWRGDDAAERDFRPLLERLRRRTGEAERPVESRSFAESGVHVLRDDATAVYLRAGPVMRRGGHADQLQIDLWHDGSWVTADAGSYSYAGDRHAWFAGSASHNGIVVDGEGQMELAGRFTWVGDVVAVLTEWDPDRDRMVARCDAWTDAQLRWEREVVLEEATLRVVDRVEPTGRGLHDHDVRLHWLVPGEARLVDGGVQSEASRLTVQARPIVGTLRARSLRLVEAQQSWYYGTLQPATSVICEVTARGVEFETRFDLA